VSATHGSTATRGNVLAGAEGGNVLAGGAEGQDAEGQDTVVTAWREMAACHAAACAALERELGERHGLGVSDFEVLERLAESDGRKFRAQDLAEAVHLSQSALSRLVDRLARHGLVERCGCDVDRRGIYVVLTEAGERRHAEAVPTHRGVLARHLPASMLGTQYRAASSGG
jgi:DNA-binding MarR family transcriptional regulator